MVGRGCANHTISRVLLVALTVAWLSGCNDGDSVGLDLGQDQGPGGDLADVDASLDLGLDLSMEIGIDQGPASDADAARDLPALDHPIPSDITTPDAATPDAAKPDAATPDATTPDAAKPDAAKPDAGSPTPDASTTVPYTGSFPAGTGDLTASLTVAGIVRTITIFRPSSVGTKPPLMIAFHGTHGKGWDMVKPYGAYARELALSKGLVLLAPQARKMTKGDWDNHYPNDVYWETYPSVSPATNPDLKLVQAMIHQAQQAYGVDPKRVYTLGHSSGGFFSTLAAMALPHQIAAFVSNSAGLVTCSTMQSCSFTGTGTSCAAFAAQSGYCSCSGVEKPGPVVTAGRKPPGYLVHSNDDTAVSVQYTCTLAARMQALGFSSSLKILSGNGHTMPYNLALDAWPFLSQHKLP